VTPSGYDTGEDMIENDNIFMNGKKLKNISNEKTKII